MILLNSLIINLNTIPNELTLREHSGILIIGIGIFVSFLLMSVAKLLKSDIYQMLSISFIKIQGLYSFVKESHSFNSGSGMLLILNYLLSSSVVLFIIVNFPSVEIQNESAFVMLTPLGVLALNVISLRSVGLLSGEIQLIIEPVQMKLIGSQLLGVIYFILAFVWVLLPINEPLFLALVIGAYMTVSMVRILKSIILISSKGVSWYYLILYFCTLEIMPLFVIYYLLLRGSSY